jgi:hypothetical protein
MSRTSFAEFTSAVEQLLSTARASVGGDLNTRDFAAYDPVFWLAHANVDRIWFRWQLKNPKAEYPSVSTGVLVDSTGSFSGLTLIKELSRWVVQNDATDVMPLPTDTSVTNLTAGAKTSTGHTELTPIRFPSNALRCELRPMPTAYHLILTLLQLPSSPDPLQIEVFIDQTCVGNVFVSGTGSSGRPYVRDTPFDITYGYMKTCPQSTTAETMKKMNILVHNLRTGETSNKFAASAMLKWGQY